MSMVGIAFTERGTLCPKPMNGHLLNMEDTTTKYLDTKTAARLIGFSYKTLESWRSKGEGPRYHQLPNKRVRYLREDLDEWVNHLSDTATKH